jgi:hypothetical protein
MRLGSLERIRNLHHSISVCFQFGVLITRRTHTINTPVALLARCVHPGGWRTGLEHF